MDPDEVVLERWRSGDEASGRELFTRYFDQLYRFFATKCAEPDELVQTTFLKIMKAKEQFRGNSSFRTYVFAIARNELYGHLRDLQKARRFDPQSSSIAEIVTTPGSRLARNAEHQRLCEILRSLSVEQQTLLELHYWEDLDAPALAEVFGIDAGAVRARLYRARTALREAMLASRSAPDAALVSVENLDTWARSFGRV